MRQYILFIFISILCSCGATEESLCEIKINNNSKDTIAYLLDDRFYNPHDPLMFDSLPELNENKSMVFIEPNNYYIDFIIHVESYFDRYPDGKTKIYILSKDKINKYSWNQIRASSNYLRRYDLGLDDFFKINWSITYP